MDADRIEQLCEVMHDAYEAAAITHDWQTQTSSRKPWSMVPEANKATMREAVTVLLAAVGYPAHQSSNEGTCWCPVAEQAGRERDALRAERDRLQQTGDALYATVRNLETERDRFRAVLAKIEYGGHSEGCNRAHGVTHQWAQRPGCNCHMREVRAALDAEETP